MKMPKIVHVEPPDGPSEHEKLSAENAALRAEVDAFREDAANYYRLAKETDAQQAALRARVAELEYVAGLMWDRYEDGEPCYEGMTDDDTGTYTGQAVYFSDEETARILAAIPEERLPGNKTEVPK